MELSKEESERRQNRERKGRKVTGKQAQRRNEKNPTGGEREKNLLGGEREKAFVGVKDKIIRGRRKIRWGLGEKKPVGLGGARWRSVEVGGLSGAGGARWGSVGPVEVGGGR